MIDASSGTDRHTFGAPGGSRRALLRATAGLLSSVMGFPGLPQAGPRPRSIRWVAFYGERVDEAVLAAYDVVILDPGFQGSVDMVGDAGACVCSYLSLGEIRTSDPSIDVLNAAALLQENPDWPGTHRVDVRDSSWRSVILEHKIPSIVARGFKGLMFDTLDTAPYLEEIDPARYRGMRGAAIALVDAIRARWPAMTLIMNRGYALLPAVLGQLDAVIAESLMTYPDQRTGGFAWVDPRQLELQLLLLQPAASRRPPLPILSLDYWSSDDVTTVAEIYRRERALGHHPYVATRLLDQIVPEAG
jgi:polysaccharide biosynthesis protein PelA